MDAQLLKSRDDKTPIRLIANTDKSDTQKPFKLSEGEESSWLKPNTPVGPSELRPRIEPWLTALFQSEHLGLLIGSGLPQAIHRLATNKALPGMGSAKFTQFENEIGMAANASAKAAGRETGNLEDQIRVASDILRGLEILGLTDKESSEKAKSLRTELELVLRNFVTAILGGENGLITAKAEKQTEAFNYLVSFLMSFASRTGTRERLQIFTTNYDRFIEAGAEVAGLHLIDRFVGSLAAIFRSSRLEVDVHYNPPGIRGEPRYLEGVAKITKLHGSLEGLSFTQLKLSVEWLAFHHAT